MSREWDDTHFAKHYFNFVVVADFAIVAVDLEPLQIVVYICGQSTKFCRLSSLI